MPDCYFGFLFYVYLVLVNLNCIFQQKVLKIRLIDEVG